MRNQICGVPRYDLYFRKSGKYDGLFLFLAAARCGEQNFFFASYPLYFPYSAVPIRFCVAIPSRITMMSSTEPGITSSGEIIYKITSIISMPYITSSICLPPYKISFAVAGCLFIYTEIVNYPFDSLHDSECGIEPCICTFFANYQAFRYASSEISSPVTTIAKLATDPANALATLR